MSAIDLYKIPAQTFNRDIIDRFVALNTNAGVGQRKSWKSHLTFVRFGQ